MRSKRTKNIGNLSLKCLNCLINNKLELIYFQKKSAKNRNFVFMNAAAIRDRLYDYIRVADDKKIKAIYMMLEDDIATKTEWWNNPALVSYLEKEYEAWDSGKDKGYSLADIKAEIVSRKSKKHGR